MSTERGLLSEEARACGASLVLEFDPHLLEGLADLLAGRVRPIDCFAEAPKPPSWSVVVPSTYIATVPSAIRSNPAIACVWL